VEDLKGELKRAEERLEELQNGGDIGEQTMDDRLVKVEIVTQQMNEMNNRVKKLSMMMQKLTEENILLKKQQQNHHQQPQQKYFPEPRPMFVAL